MEWYSESQLQLWPRKFGGQDSIDPGSPSVWILFNVHPEKGFGTKRNRKKQINRNNSINMQTNFPQILAGMINQLPNYSHDRHIYDLGLHLMHVCKMPPKDHFLFLLVVFLDLDILSYVLCNCVSELPKQNCFRKLLKARQVLRKYRPNIIVSSYTSCFLKLLCINFYLPT